METKVRELYRVLEVEPTADFDTIRESYRRLLKRYHPDSGGSNADAAKLDSVIEAFRRVKAVHPRRSSSARDRNRAQRSRAAGVRRPRDVFSLGRMLVSGVGTSTRTFAARSLGNLGKRSAYVFLKRGLHDREKQVVLSCLRSIGRLRIVQSAGDLSSVFQRGDVEVRRVVMETVGEIDRLELFRNLIRAGLEDSDPSVRRHAVRLFTKLER
ncbi:MAG: DnaJ domain-containing protein [Spirochaetaceae bacterium]